MIIKASIAVTVAAVALGSVGAVALVGADSASAAKPAITNLTYTPNPLYNDEIGIIVSFIASRTARPGYEWGSS